MTVSPGTRLGPYEIVALLGAGGMGEVYRARDTRLGREVAIKVLPASLTSSAEVRARFEREARTVSSLNHPNICTLYDIGREGDADYLVMELVEGETLAQRLTRGALPTADVLRLGEQVADALDRAHRAGVIHRDLKPGNIMLTKAGAKLMDFGLARATGMVPAPGSSGAHAAVGSAMLSQSPTIAQPLTAEGTIVGTFQYMAPEQLEGREADTRSDLWALGCVLYEMATGRRAFEGRSQASLIAAILERHPDPPSSISPRTPPPLDVVVARCLAKDPDDRWQNARDLMHELRVISSASVAGAASAGRAPHPDSGRRRLTLRDVAIIALVAAAAAAMGAWLSPLVHPRGGFSRPLVLSLGTMPGLTYSTLGGDMGISADGRSLVIVAADTAGIGALWVRDLGSRAMRRLEGTENASMPFWSPDARWVAYFTSDKLRKVSVAGGLPQDICSAASGRGGSWGTGDVIVFAPGAEGPLYRVSAEGGRPEAITVLDTTKHEVGHRFPRFLPDGRHFFYSTLPTVDKLHECCMGEIGSTRRTLVTRCDGTPEWTPDGWLVSFRNGMLSAQRFDPGSARFSGQPTPLFSATQGVGFLAAPVAYTSRNGELVTLPSVPLHERLAWVDRTGHEQDIAGAPIGGWFFPRLSPDGTRIACPRSSPEATSSTGVNLWTIDAVRGTTTRLTFENQITESPVWSSDGRQILYGSNVDGTYGLYLISADGGKPRFVWRGSGLVTRATDWSRDGRYVVYETDDARTSSDVWLLSMGEKPEAHPLLQTEFAEQSARISPDGHWIAYESNESGRREVYVQSFPSLGNKVQVSAQGGIAPQWRGDGRELCFETADGAMMSASVQFAPTLRVGTPNRLFRIAGTTLGRDLSPDGRRFLYALPDPEFNRMSPIIAVNWQKLIEGK